MKLFKDKGRATVPAGFRSLPITEYGRHAGRPYLAGIKVQMTEANECGIGNAEMEVTECLIYIFYRIPHSDFRIPVT